MNYEFKLTGYCEGCECAELESRYDVMQVDVYVERCGPRLICKHEAACARMAKKMEGK